MVPNINITTAFLAGFITFSLLYGIYFVLFIGSLYVSIYMKRAQKANINYIILGGNILQFVLITICYGIRWGRIYTAFITNGDRPEGPFLFLSKLNDWREVSSTGIWMMTSQIGDILLIYRLYIVSDRRILPCVIPCALLLGSLVTTIGLLVVISHPDITIYTDQLTQWAWPFLACNLVQRVLVTVLLISRIWWINQQCAKWRVGSGLWSVIIVLLESGALYSSAVLIFLVTYVVRNNAAMMMPDIVTPIMGITFSLIIVRMGLGFSNGDASVQANTANSTPIDFARSRAASPDYPLQDFSDTSTSRGDSKPRTISASYEYI